MIDGIAAKLDYVGIDYYYGHTPQDLARLSPGDIKKLWNMPLQPEGIYYALEYYSRRFPGKPLYVVENGMPTENGAPRADGYTRGDDLRDTVYWIQRARGDGMNVIGYNYWSITDNYEWGSYTPRFGMYTVDVRTDPALTRRPTDAVAAYRHPHRRRRRSRRLHPFSSRHRMFGGGRDRQLPRSRRIAERPTARCSSPRRRAKPGSASGCVRRSFDPPR